MKPWNRSWVPQFTVFVCLFLFEDNQSLQMDAEKNEFLKLMPQVFVIQRHQNHETTKRNRGRKQHMPIIR